MLLLVSVDAELEHCGDKILDRHPLPQCDFTNDIILILFRRSDVLTSSFVAVFKSHRTIDIMVMDTYFNIGVSDFKSHFSISLWTIVDTTRLLLLSSTPEEYEICHLNGAP